MIIFTKLSWPPEYFVRIYEHTIYEKKEQRKVFLSTLECKCKKNSDLLLLIVSWTHFFSYCTDIFSLNLTLKASGKKHSESAVRQNTLILKKSCNILCKVASQVNIQTLSSRLFGIFNMKIRHSYSLKLIKNRIFFLFCFFGNNLYH